MDFIELDRWTKANAGEFLYHTPTGKIVLCGKYNKDEEQITALIGSKVFRDKTENFKKIKLSERELRARREDKRRRYHGGCTSCKGNGR
jgi:stalled ribosome alternative rescue factor ArfA